MSAHNVVVWPEFMLHDPVANTLWDYLWSDFPEYQLALLDSDGAIMAAANSAPLSWDGTDAGLPSGWDDQFERTMAGHRAGTAPNTLGALQIVVAPGRQGQGLSAVMVDAFRALARDRGFGAVIACVRPTLKHRYPLMPMSDYVAWQRDDGLPWDAWLRVHVRAGGRDRPGVAAIDDDRRTDCRLAHDGPARSSRSAVPTGSRAPSSPSRSTSPRTAPRTTTPTCGSSTGCSRRRSAGAGLHPAALPVVPVQRPPSPPRVLVPRGHVAAGETAALAGGREPRNAVCRVLSLAFGGGWTRRLRRYPDRAAERWPSG